MEGPVASNTYVPYTWGMEGLNGPSPDSVHFEKEAGQRQNKTIQNQMLFNCETQLTSRHDVLTTSGNLKGYGRAKRKQTHTLSQHFKTASPGEVEGPWQHTSSRLSVHLHSVGPVILCNSRGKPRDWGGSHPQVHHKGY